MIPAGNRAWLSLDDGQSATWLFEVDFLLSNYHCVYGRGCRSITEEPDPTGVIGCCNHGAHFIDGTDRKRVAALAEQLEDGEWQYRRRAMDRGGPLKKKGGEWVTRKADGACIFLNREDFAAGPGCALHIGALNRGARPLEWKPAVCWQVPIRLDVHVDDYGYETVLVRAWRRRDWGPGGQEFHWWCVEDEIAYSAREPLYVTARDELSELMGPDLYRRLVAELDRLLAEEPERRRAGVPVTIGGKRRPGGERRCCES